MTGLAVTGFDVTGLAVVGFEVTGLAVTGFEVTGAAVGQVKETSKDIELEGTAIFLIVMQVFIMIPPLYALVFG